MRTCRQWRIRLCYHKYINQAGESSAFSTNILASWKKQGHANTAHYLPPNVDRAVTCLKKRFSYDLAVDFYALYWYPIQYYP